MNESAGRARLGSLAAAIVLLACAPIASAQDSDAATLGSIEVQGHYDNGVGTSDAASEGVVRGDRLTDLPLLRPGEVLETIPGMVVTQHSGDGKANQYFLRGYNLDHGTDFATTIDGVPANMPTNAHGQGYMDLNFLIPELVQSIDYRKGPYFADEGDFSSAGAAHIHYRDSLDAGIAALTTGSYGYRRALFAGSTTLGDGTGPTLLGALEVAEGNGPWTVPEDLRKINGLLRLSDGTLAHGWSIDAQAYSARWNSTDQVPLGLIRSGLLSRFSGLDPTDGGDTGRTILSGEWHSRDGNAYTQVQAFAEHYDLQLWSNFTFFELRPDTGDQFEQQESRNFFGGEVVRGWDHSLFGHDSVFETGLQLRRDDIRVGLLNTEARQPFETVRNDAVGETAAGLYAQESTTWTPWFRTLAGLREQTVSMNVRAYATPINSGSAAADKLLPKLSMIFGPWNKTEFFLNYGEGFHSNDARGVVQRIDPTSGDLASPVPALAGSIGKEIGVRTEAIEGLQSSLALWSLDSASELIYSADSNIGSTDANGASRRYGVEWNSNLVLNRWLLVDADLAWTHARYVDANANGQLGNQIPNAVGKVGSLAFTVRDMGPWSGGLVTRYIGSYPLSQDGSLVAPSSTVTNLRVSRALTPKVSLSVDLLNVFNRRYYDIAYEQDYQLAPASPVVPNGVTVHPGEPRQLRITLRVAL